MSVPRALWSAAARRGLCASTAGRRVRVHEVAPRDGLQNEKAILPTEKKLALLRRLVATSPASIEVSSFVRADLIPALADADELCERLWDQPWAQRARDDGMAFAGLVLNKRGFERFHRSQLDTATVVVACSESFSKRNANRSVADALALACEMIEDGRKEGLRMRGYTSVTFGCPFDGDVDPARVHDAIVAMGEAGADAVVLGDTTGVGRPDQVRSILEDALRVLPPERLGLHMHDTYERVRDASRCCWCCCHCCRGVRGLENRLSACERSARATRRPLFRRRAGMAGGKATFLYGTFLIWQAVENCAVGVDLGIAHMDSSVGGCGGCPFAGPEAKGNLATADLVELLDGAGVSHGDTRWLTMNDRSFMIGDRAPSEDTTSYPPPHRDSARRTRSRSARARGFARPTAQTNAAATS